MMSYNLDRSHPLMGFEIYIQDSIVVDVIDV